MVLIQLNLDDNLSKKIEDYQKKVEEKEGKKPNKHDAIRLILTDLEV